MGRSLFSRFALGLTVAVTAFVAVALPARGQPPPPPSVYLPSLFNPSAQNLGCQAIAGARYGQIPIVGPPASPPPATHPDINLDIRGWRATDAPHQLVSYNGTPDPNAPQLWGLFTDQRVPTISAVYQVYDWNWGTGQRGGPIPTFPVTLAGFQVQPGEIIQDPVRNVSIGNGFNALVLYASTTQITLGFTGNDSVAGGYAIHIEGICVEPSLLTLFQSLSGGPNLPGVNSSQPIGRANGTEIDVAIRDTGSFMDPRSQRDWWQGK